MNKKQYKLIALSLAMTMAVSSISYAANADRKVSAAAKTDNEVLTVAKKDIIRKNETNVSSGPVIEEPEIPAKSKISFTRLGSKKVKISWSRSASAEKYILYKKTNNNGYKIVAKTTKLKFTDKKVVAGKRYKYYVKSQRTYDGKTYASNSNAKSFRIANFVNTKHQKYSYSEMCGDIKSFKNTYSDYVSVKVVGKSNDKRNIYDVVIGNKKAKKTLLVIGNIHAREYMTAQLCMAQIESYLKNYNGSVKGVKVKNVLNKMAVHYIPMANPDGTTISQFGISKIRDRKLRKALYKMSGASHTATWKANARGVDLNRNSNSHFKANHGGKRGSEGFSGPSAASEPETKAIAGLLKQLKNNKTLKGVVNYILRDNPDVLSVFVHADDDFCLARAMERNSFSEKETKKFIERTDKYRSDFYHYHTGHHWTDARYYDLCLDSSKLGFEKCVEEIEAYAKIRFRK